MSKSEDRMRRLRARASGFSLIETVIAIAVVAVTFIGIIGLLGLGLATDQTSSQQTIATNIVASIVADLRSTPNYATASTRYKMTLATTLSPGTTAAPLSGVTPSYYLYFDNSSNFLPVASPIAYTTVQSPVPSGAAYVAAVYMSRLATVGTAPAQTTNFARIVVSWPAQAAGTAVGGNVDVITEYQIH